MKSKIFFATLIIGLLILTTFRLNLVAQQKPLPPIKIGLIQSTSGMAGQWGVECLEGFNIRMNEINAKGGVKTKEGLRKIEAIVRDDQMKPDIGLKEAKSLILEEKCSLLALGISSAMSQAVSAWAKENRVIYFSGSAKSHHLTGKMGHRYYFRMTANTWMYSHTAAYYFKDKPYTRWGLLNQDYAYGRDSVDAFIHGMKAWKPGFQVVTEQWPKLGTTDFTPYITAIMAAKPEIIFSSLWGTDLYTFIKQAKGYGFFNKIKFVVTSGGLELLRPIGQEMVEGMYCMAEGPFQYPGTPENKKFYDEYKAKTGEFPSAYSFEGYNVLSFLVAAIEKAGTVETEAMVDALEGITIPTPVLPVKKITMRKCDHQSNIAVSIGVTARDPKWPWFVLKDITSIPGDNVMESCEEIMAERAAQN